MLVISSKEFRDNQAKYMDKVDSGEQVIVQRGKNKAYSLTPVTDNDLYFTPSMIERIKQSIQQSKEGKSMLINNKNELMELLEKL